MNNSTENILSKLQYSNDIFELVFEEIVHDDRIIDLNHKFFSAKYSNLSKKIPTNENTEKTSDEKSDETSKTKEKVNSKEKEVIDTDNLELPPPIYSEVLIIKVLKINK
jgi:hypothetical protein